MKISRKIDPSLQLLAAPIITIIVGAVLAFVVFQIGYPKVIDGMQEIDKTKKINTTLNERLNVLKEFNAGVLDDQSDIVFNVFPEKNPGSAMVSQIRGLVQSGNMTLKSVTFTQTGKDTDIEKADFTYEYLAEDLPKALGLLLSLKNLAPLSTIESVAINQEPDGIVTKATSSIYWASFPTKLPDLTEPLTDLSSDDKKLMTEIFGYKLPLFVNLKAQPADVNRANPFE